MIDFPAEVSVCICVCVYIYMCICIYIYTHMYHNYCIYNYIIYMIESDRHVCFKIDSLPG